MALRILILTFLALQIALMPEPSRADPPPIPSFLPGFPLIAGDNALVAWSPVPGAAAYRIYMDGRFLETTGEPRYMVPVPGSADEIRIQVSAVSPAGEESGRSPAGVLMLRKLEAPKDLETAFTTDPPSVVMVWKGVRGAIWYNIYRSDPGGEPALLNSGMDSYFRDRSVAAGSRYLYMVAAIDRFGREGERSRATVIEITDEKKLPPTGRARAGGKSFPGTGGAAKDRESGIEAKGSVPGAAFREIRSIDKINGRPLTEVSFLGAGNDNAIWVVLPREREIHAMNPSGDVVSSLGPAQIDAARKGFVPHKMDLAPDGRVVVSSVRNGVVACFDRKGDLLWSAKVDPPAADETEVWEGFPPERRSLPSSPSSLLFLPREIWVTDQRLQLIYRLSHDGIPLGYISHYKRGEDVWRLKRVGELEAVPGKGIFLTFPLATKALLLDEGLQVVSEIVSHRRDKISGFLGIHGIQFVSGEGILLTDPTTGRIKLFDPDTGEHLRDLRIPLLNRPNMAVRDADGKIWVYLAGERRIAVLGLETSGK